MIRHSRDISFNLIPRFEFCPPAPPSPESPSAVNGVWKGIQHYAEPQKRYLLARHAKISGRMRPGYSKKHALRLAIPDGAALTREIGQKQKAVSTGQRLVQYIFQIHETQSPPPKVSRYQLIVPPPHDMGRMYKARRGGITCAVASGISFF